MANATQNFRLISLLKAGDKVSKETIAKTLGVSDVSVPVYIHELKRLFKANIESVYNGRRVVAYKLINRDIVVPQFRRNNSTPTPTKKSLVKVEAKVDDGSVPVPDKDLEIAEITDREFSDIRSSLGVSSFGSRGSSDY